MRLSFTSNTLLATIKAVHNFDGIAVQVTYSILSTALMIHLDSPKSEDLTTFLLWKANSGDGG